MLVAYWNRMTFLLSGESPQDMTFALSEGILKDENKNIGDQKMEQKTL